MKNLFTLIILAVSLVVSAQSVDSKLTKGGKFKGLDRQGDTLIASSTVNYTLELGTDVSGMMTIGVESDSVSGTSAFDSYLYASNNGVDWGIPIDTITHSGGGDYYSEFDILSAIKNYYRVSTVATSATQKSRLKIWGRINEGFVLIEGN